MAEGTGAPKQDHTPTPWRVANGKGVASVKGPDCAIYLNVRTVETDDCVARWQADARLIVEAVNAHASLVAALRGLEDKSEPGRFCDHAAAPCHRCDAAAAALAGAQKGESRD